MPDLFDQLYDAQVLLRNAERDGDDAGAEILSQRIEYLERQIEARG